VWLSRVRVRDLHLSAMYASRRKQGENDMNIDDSDAENIVLHEDGGGGGNTSMQSTRYGGKGKDPDPEFTLGREFEKEDEGENQGFTPVTRRRTRAIRVTDSPATL
jgi:hypothetical protein